MKRALLTAAILLGCLTQTWSQSTPTMPSLNRALKQGDTFRASDWNATMALKTDWPPSVFSATAVGSVPASGGGQNNFLRADGTWAAPTLNSASPFVDFSTSTPAMASGSTAITGTIGIPTLGNDGAAIHYNTTTGGAVIQGRGSINDVALLSRAGAIALQVPTNTSNVQVVGTIASGANGGTGGSITLNGSTSGSATLNLFDAAASFFNMNKGLVTSGTLTTGLNGGGTNGQLTLSGSTSGAAALVVGNTGNLTIVAGPSGIIGANGQIVTGQNGGLGGAVSFNGATSGNRTLAVNATGTAFTFGGGALAVAEGGTGDTGTAWSSFTPAYSCGSATFTNNSAKSKTLGKTTFIELDFTITAIGTCTNQITVTFPNTANSAGAFYVQEVQNSGAGGSCRFSSGASWVCVKIAAVNFLVNERWLGSGLYENQ